MFSSCQKDSEEGNIIIDGETIKIKSFHCPIEVTSGQNEWCYYQIRFEESGETYTLDLIADGACDEIADNPLLTWDVNLYIAGDPGFGTYRANFIKDIDFTSTSINFSNIELTHDDNPSEMTTVSSDGNISCE